MLLTVVYKSGTERSFKNVTGIHTSVRYDDETEKPVYEIRFTSLEDNSDFNLHDIKSFEITDEGKWCFRLDRDRFRSLDWNWS